MTQDSRTVSGIRWKRMLAGALIRGVLSVVFILGTAWVGVESYKLLGLRPKYQQNLRTVMVAVPALLVLWIHARPALCYVVGELRATGTGDEYHTTEEVWQQAKRVRRRHYYKQVGKAAYGAFVAVVCAIGAFFILTDSALRSELPNMFEGVAPGTVLAGALLIGVISGTGMAVKAWRNRFKDPDTSLIQALKELER